MSYQGSHLLEFLSEPLGLPIDKFNFVVTELVALLSGLLFRYYCKPCARNTLKRHLVCILWGIALGHFCYGHQMWHLFTQAFLCYLSLIFCPRKYVQYLIFFISMGYLSSVHIYRMIYDYGNYTLDITGAMMVLTQKLTSLGFAYYDGMRPAEKLNEDQRSQQIKECPHIIEFLSYAFNFQGIIVGPLVYYQDYIDFITGNNILKHKQPGKSDDETSSVIIVQPSYYKAVLKKLFASMFCAVIYFKISTVYSCDSNLDPEILMKPIWFRFVYFYMSASSQRFRYYFGWLLAEAVNNASGLGFNGYDKDNNPKWDLITNVKMVELETSTSIKSVFDNWNIQTQLWFRRIAYDRLPTGKTLGVFILSALWHGFYPGYYLTFVLCAFMVYTGRGIRRKIRPHFQKNAALKALYAILTWVGTIFSLNYAAVSFDVYELGRSFEFYNSWYWIVHIFVFITPFILPGGSTKPKKDGEHKSNKDKTSSEQQQEVNGKISTDEIKKD